MYIYNVCVCQPLSSKGMEHPKQMSILYFLIRAERQKSTSLAGAAGGLSEAGTNEDMPDLKAGPLFSRDLQGWL